MFIRTSRDERLDGPQVTRGPHSVKHRYRVFLQDFFFIFIFIQSDTKKRELLKNPIKIEEIQEKKIIDRN